jgi:hypothetical protein
MQRISRSWASSTGTKAVPGCSGDHGEAGVPPREEAFEKVVGGIDAVDAGERQLLRQAVLQGPEGALGAAASLRREAGDVLDAQVRQRPADLGARLRVGLLAGLGRDEIGLPRSV